MKVVKKLIGFVLLVVIIVVGIFIYNGYVLYKDALNNIGVKDKVAQIKENKDYTKIYLEKLSLLFL